ERYKDLLRVCPHHGFTELHQLDTFYNALNPSDQDSLNAAAGGNLLEKSPQDALTIIENKSKVRNSQSKPIASLVNAYDNHSSSELAKLTHAINQQTSDVTTAMTAMLKQFQSNPPPAQVKAVEEICVTCGGAHSYYQCLAAGGNTFPEFQDNIQGELKAITTQSGLVLDGPSVPMPPPFINPEEDECVEETLTDQDLAEYTIKFPPPLVQKAKPPSQRNYVKLGDPGKFLIPCGFCELKCKALADLDTSINLMPLSVWKNLGLPKLISTRMTLKLANRAICTPARIARDVFVLVGKFTFPADFVILDYESDPRVLIILGRPFLRTARALIVVHGEEMILHDGDERLALNMRHDTSSYSNQPQKESINMISIYNDSCEDYLEDLFATNHLSSNPTFSYHTDLTSPEVINQLSGSTTSSSPDHLLEEFADELALITFPPRNDDLLFHIESDLRGIEYLLNHDPTKEMDSILEDSIDKCNLANPNVDLVDTIPEMFTNEHTLDDSSPPLYDDFDDDLDEFKSDNEYIYNDPLDSKEDKIKESKLLIDELDPPRSSDFLPSPEYDSFLFEDFSEVEALPSTDNKDKVFNP
nr:reverse transcriptase domain-containing protein [Tanacetum cinerariifolium]